MLAKVRRSRVIRFRVSPEESDRLAKFLPISGARSLSDLARTALLHAIAQGGAHGEPSVGEELRRLNRSINDLREQVSEIRRLLAGQEARGDAPVEVVRK